ncbi:hypothetical protein B7494_g567 [Chlorociboria aeruginascens]|nr:hypothetical protein B7494_g567 [Chlorociboria aeruginascens]
MLSKLLLCAPLLAAVPVWGAIQDQLPAVPDGWTLVGPPDANALVSFTIGLQLQNLDQLEPQLLAVSTPGNARYGQHLDIDDVNALFAPTSEANDAVQSWLRNSGVTSIQSDGHFVDFATTIEKANQLMNTTFLIYESSGVSKIRTLQYSIPDDLAQDIDLISPTTFFGKTVAAAPSVTRKRASAVQVDASCQTSISPSCVKELYNVGDYAPDPNSGSKIGFGSFLNESALYADLAQYEATFNIPSQNFSVILINGGVNDQDPATAQVGEADLDVQNIIGVSHPLPVTEFITGGSPPFIPDIDEPAGEDTNEPYIPYYQYLLSKPNSELPQVISNSYGDEELTVPKSYAIRVCNMIGLLGLRGITVLESAGDTGIGAGCQTPDGQPRFNAQFPGTCPYLLSVGGTQAVTPEVAWADGSGGFSDYFAQPLYQSLAVETYLNFYISPATKQYYSAYANFSSRGFPDISAHSLTPDYQVVYDGELSPSGGTSAAAPVVASIIALLNDARLRAGKSALGFINPLLYAIGFAALNDITGGSAVGCNGVNGQTGAPIPGGSIIPYAAWNATPGWDPVTGLGTPDFQKLKALVLSLP